MNRTEKVLRDIANDTVGVDYVVVESSEGATQSFVAEERLSARGWWVVSRAIHFPT